jgi:cobalt-zinc-cadmium efflux system outer membrane protein
MRAGCAGTEEGTSAMPPKWLPWALGLLLVSGCTYPVRDDVDRVVCDLATHPIDPQPPTAAPQPMPPALAKKAADAPRHLSANLRQTVLMRTAAQVPAGRATTPPERVHIPPELPGANVPPITLPPLDAPRAEREAAAREYFPELEPLRPEPEPAPGPNGQPLTLTDLQELAMASSPAIREAATDLKAAQGAARQAGAYPNPTVSYEEDTAGNAGTGGFQGGFVEQVIKTGGKLKLAQAAGQMDVRNGELALRAARNTVASQVRSGYFAVLVAQESVKVNRALVRLSDEVYGVETDRFIVGKQAAAYEPLPFRVLAAAARGAYVQALNRYTSAWTQLAAAVGRPDMPPTQLAGRPDLPIPLYRYDTVLARVLSRHTDVLSAQNSIQRARYNLRLAQVTPISDVDVRAGVQKDFTAAPFLVVHTLSVGVTVPVWDQNNGAIMQAQANLLHAVEDVHRVRDDLTTRLADAFERYENARILLEYYLHSILPDQVRVFQGVYRQWQATGETPGALSVIDISTAQQNLATSLATYLTTLGALWQSVSDVAALLQTDDLFQLAAGQCPAPVPDLQHLADLPCTHPCSPLPGPIKGANGFWPPAVPPKDQPVMPHAPFEAAPAGMPRLDPPARTSGGDDDTPCFTLPVPAGVGPRTGAKDMPNQLPEALELPALPLPRPVRAEGAP